MSIFIDRAGCSSPDLKGDLLEEWDDIRAELPGQWRRALRKAPRAFKNGDVVYTDEGPRGQPSPYYVLHRAARAQAVKLDVTGRTYTAGPIVDRSTLGKLRPVTHWGPGVVGPAHTTYPHPQ